MSDKPPAQSAKAPPLFTLELKENGGRFAPTTYEELNRWIQQEQSSWNWIQQRSFGNHQNGSREAIDHLGHALNHAQQAQQHRQSNPQHAQQQVDACRSRLEEAFQRYKLPHSSTPLAKRIEAYRKEAGDQAASYFLSFFVSSPNGQVQFQAQELAAWRGIFEGLFERFQFAEAAPKGRKQAAELSFEELRVQAEDLVSKKSIAYEELHRNFEALAESIQVAAAKQTTGFDLAQKDRQVEFDTLKAEHKKEMDSLRNAFREEMSLRAPAGYWSEKRDGHRFWAWVTGAFSFAGIATAAVVIGLQIHDLLKNTAQGSSPETWRLAVLALIGVFTVWALRLLVRMFLSHLHLLTDASERVVMVQTYLSLLEGDNLDSKEDRHLILQALFRPASDGIVKDEGVPFSFAELLTRSGKP